VISKINISDEIYTDTDSCKIKYEAYLKWADEYAMKTEVPHWREVEAIDPKLKGHPLLMPIGDLRGTGATDSRAPTFDKVFGSFDDENAESCAEHKAADNLSIFCAKKSYCVGRSGDSESLRSAGGSEAFAYKSLMKGVGKRDLFIPAADEINMPAIGADQYELYKYYMANRATNEMALSAVPMRLMRQLFETKHATVICTSFKKNLRNTKRNVSPGAIADHNEIANSISMCVRIKHLDISHST
jgi:hypothetical protein